MSSGRRSQSVPARRDEQTRRGRSGDLGRPLSAAVEHSTSPSGLSETPRRAGTPPIHTDNVRVDQDRRTAETPKRSPPPVLPDADSSTFSVVSRYHDYPDDVRDEEKRAKSKRHGKNARASDEASGSSLTKRRMSSDEGLTTNTESKRRYQQRRCENLDLDQHGGDDDERPTSTSGRLTALESLQGLVYRQTLGSEHPLDGLQRLIYGGVTGGDPTATSHVSVQLSAGGQSSGGADDIDHFQTGRSPVLAPQTLILVNPIVTVVSKGVDGGGEVPAPGAPSTPKPSATAGGGGSTGGVGAVSYTHLTLPTILRV